MTDTIVVGVDDSSGARAALAWASRQAASTGGRLRVVHAYDLNIAWIDINSPELPQWEKQAHEKADEILARIVDDVLPLEQRDSVELRTVVGPPAEVLHGQSLDAALLVVGSRGRGGFTSLLLGSVSQQLAQHAPCPIVIIPPPAGDRTAPNAN